MRDSWAGRGATVPSRGGERPALCCTLTPHQESSPSRAQRHCEDARSIGATRRPDKTHASKTRNVADVIISVESRRKSKTSYEKGQPTEIKNEHCGPMTWCNLIATRNSISFAHKMSHWDQLWNMNRRWDLNFDSDKPIPILHQWAFLNCFIFASCIDNVVWTHNFLHLSGGMRF